MIEIADNKYGEIYTEDEVVKLIRMAVDSVLDMVAQGVDKPEIMLTLQRGRYPRGGTDGYRAHVEAGRAAVHPAWAGPQGTGSGQVVP